MDGSGRGRAGGDDLGADDCQWPGLHRREQRYGRGFQCQGMREVVLPAGDSAVDAERADRVFDACRGEWNSVFRIGRSELQSHRPALCVQAVSVAPASRWQTAGSFGRRTSWWPAGRRRYKTNGAGFLRRRHLLGYESLELEAHAELHLTSPPAVVYPSGWLGDAEALAW